MYKSIEISDIIGFLFCAKWKEKAIHLDTIEKVQEEILILDQFIRIEGTAKSIKNYCLLVESNEKPKDHIIELPQDEGVRSRFERKFYRLDIQTRSTVQKATEKILQI